ncbi:MAG: transposase [Turicibacter sp.]
MKPFLTVSDETRIESPLYLFYTLDKLKSLSKKQKGSNGRKKARKNLSRLHRKIANQREDFQWKIANELVGKYDTLCFEDLNIKAMQMLWGCKISDLSFSSFLLKVEYLAAKNDKKVVKIDRFFAS